jgi:hypothetical protein
MDPAARAFAGLDAALNSLAGEDVATQTDVLADLLRGDEREVEVLVELLARKMLRLLPDRATVTRRRAWLVGDPRVLTVEVRLAERHFSIERDGQRWRAVVTRVARGVRLARDEVNLDEWATRLATDLLAEVRTVASMRRRLQGALGEE